MQLCYITTVFNAEKTLAATIGSSFVTEDAVTAHIVVDDGSTDGTPDLLVQLRARHGPKLKVISTGRVGRANALNIALEEAESVADVAMNIDADDVSAPHRPAATTRFYDPDYACCGGAAAMVHPDSSALRRYPSGGKELARALSLGVALCNTASAYSPKEVLAVGGFRELKAWLDHDLWVRLIERGKPVANVGDVVAIHRVYPDSHFKRRHRSEFHLSLALTRHLAARAPQLGQPSWLPWLRLPYRFTPMVLRHRLTPGSKPLPATIDEALRRFAEAPDQHPWPLAADPGGFDLA